MADLKTMRPAAWKNFSCGTSNLLPVQAIQQGNNGNVGIGILGWTQTWEITTPLDDKTLSQYVTSLVRGVMFDCKNAGKIGDIDAHVRDIMEFLTRGLGFTSPTK